MPAKKKAATRTNHARVALPNAKRPRSVGSTEAGLDRDRKGTGRTYRGRESRERIEEAARRVFERDGFLQARVADICDEAGLSHGSFYTYFHSKEEIFKRIADQVEQDLLAMPSEPKGSAIDRIRTANRHYLESYKKNAGMLAVINQVASFDRDALLMRTERLEAFAHAMERRIREQQKAGLADPDIDPRFAARALGGMVTFMAEQLFIGDMPGSLDKAVEQLTALWANAIGLSRGPRRRT